VRVGVVSDTHGELPGRVVEVFDGVDRIIHAGDVGSYEVLSALMCMAPVVVVFGNTDLDSFGRSLPGLANVVLDGVRVLVVHKPSDVPRPLPADVRVVVTGHTHVPDVHEADGVLWLNPGSPSRARGHGHTVAVLDIADASPSARVVLV
jgi:putative phosphoesterase